MSKPVPIRRSLLINLLVVVALLSVATVGTMWMSARRAVHKLSAAVIEQALDRAELELRGFFDPVERQLVTLRGWVEDGLVRPDDPEGAERVLTEPLGRYPWTEAMFVADELGQFFVLSFKTDIWATEQIRDTATGWIFRREEWTDDDPTRRVGEPFIRNVRQRP